MTEGNDAHGPMPWYRSPVYIGIAVSIVSQILAHAPKVAVAFGLIDQGAISTVVTDIFNGVGFLAVLYAERKRANSKLQPITLTQGNANAQRNAPPPADKPPAGSDGLS